MTKKMKILIVDDRKENLLVLRQVLHDVNAEVIEATSGNQALVATLVHDFALAILDVQMPGMDGYELAELLRNDRKTNHLPIIFMTAAYGEEAQVFKGYEAGAVDYIVKPYNPDILLAKVRVFLDLHCTQKELAQRLLDLAASEERYRTLVATIPDIVYRIDPEGRFTFLNEAVRFLGYCPEDLIGLPFSVIIHPNDLEPISHRFMATRFAGNRTGEEKALKLFDERRTGTRKTIALLVHLVSREDDRPVPAELFSTNQSVLTAEVNSSGLYARVEGRSPTFLGTVGVIRDITGRMKIEQALKESEARLRTIFDCVAAGLIVIDPKNHTISDANPSALQMIGLPKSSVIGETCHNFICPNEKEKCPVTDLGETINHSENTLLNANGNTIPILKTVVPIVLEGREHLLESFVDISLLKAAEKELLEAHETLEQKVIEKTVALRESQAQIIEAEKLGALGVLTAGIAHELNNPMMGILNFIQYCLKHTPPDSRLFEILSDTQHEIKRCILIVKNLLTFSRMEKAQTEELEQVHISVIIDRVLNLLNYRIDQEGVSVERKGESGLPPIFVKTSNIQQVFL